MSREWAARSPIFCALCGLLAVLVVLGSAPARALELVGRVVRVSDGDSITVLDPSRREFRVRLGAIDAPEKGQAFGRVAKSHLADLLFDRIVHVQVTKVDRYGRLIGRVMVNGTDACLEQLRAGLAWHYRRYEDEQTPDLRAAYTSAEARARAAGIGLWRDARPTPPWVWRRR